MVANEFNHASWGTQHQTAQLFAMQAHSDAGEITRAGLLFAALSG
jgi:hypothetical protein